MGWLNEAVKDCESCAATAPKTGGRNSGSGSGSNDSAVVVLKLRANILVDMEETHAALGAFVDALQAVAAEQPDGSEPSSSPTAAVAAVSGKGVIRLDQEALAGALTC